MYFLTTPLSQVKGIGPNLADTFTKRELITVKDLLCFLPLHYEDRSQRATIAQLTQDQLVTFVATVKKTGNFYRGRRSIQSATVEDETGKVKLMWFNNRFVIGKLVVGQSFLFSGKLNDRGMVIQPVVEDIKENTLHTDRLVPVYSALTPIKQGTVRRLLDEILQHLAKIDDPVAALIKTPDLPSSFRQLHFPDLEKNVVKARERLALEELLSLMKKSQEIKADWQANQNAPPLKLKAVKKSAAGLAQFLPDTLPFTLTGDQQKAAQEILEDIQQPVPMNRLLLGDVGSGKTVVAGLVALQAILNKKSVALIAPTRILAQQHKENQAKLLPQIQLTLITSQTKLKPSKQPALYIGTHAVINQLKIIKPALIVFDEQHRFGVNQRSQSLALNYSPHILTMSATPIPRSLMLTIFAHLQLSTIDELPVGRQPTKTWVVPEFKRTSAFTWIAAELAKHQAQALVICPFIDPSNAKALENVAAVNQTFEALKKLYKSTNSPKLGLLHGRQKKTEQAEVVAKLYDRKIDLLVTTPIVEVGIDLPAASIMVIEAADRFGLASLHQLRGRVGRAGQQGYCLLFSQGKNQTRLQKFSNLTKGNQIAELDLEYRGAGDIFGTEQHGFDQLKFASWANVALIGQARQVFKEIGDTSYQPLFYQPVTAEPQDHPLAN